MPKVAILGATGATGQQILKQLLESPKNEIKCYVRSKAKLQSLFPRIEDNEQVHIFEGRLNDTSLIASCIQSTNTVFAVLGSNDNMPGIHISRDSAEAVISASKEIRSKDPTAKLPRIVVLSSMTINPTLCKDVPKIQHWAIYNAFYHEYQDLELAEKMYAEVEDWLDVRFVQPGGLVHGERNGSRLSLTEHSDFLSYADLAAAMIEISENGEFEGKKVGVVVEVGSAKFPSMLPLKVLEGLTWTFAPWLYWACQYLGLK